MVLVKPATVVQSHRQGFRLFWRWRSRSGRLSLDRELWPLGGLSEPGRIDQRERPAGLEHTSDLAQGLEKNCEPVQTDRKVERAVTKRQVFRVGRQSAAFDATTCDFS
jgi:hypothetical protein